MTPRWMMAGALAVAVGCGGGQAPAPVQPPAGGGAGDRAAAPPDGPAAVGLVEVQLPDAADLVGAWRPESGDYEEISLAGDGRFATHLHSRPFTVGTWTVLDGAVGRDLRMIADGGDTEVVEQVRLEGGRLHGRIAGVAVVWEWIE